MPDLPKREGEPRPMFYTKADALAWIASMVKKSVDDAALIDMIGGIVRDKKEEPAFATMPPDMRRIIDDSARQLRLLKEAYADVRALADECRALEAKELENARSRQPAG